MSKQPDLAHGAAREFARKSPVDVQELVLKELIKIRKLLEEQKNEKDYVPYYRGGTP